MVTDELRQSVTNYAALKEDEFKRECFRLVIEMLSSSKAEAFNEEEEVRLTVFTHQIGRLANPEVSELQYRTREGLLIPYLEVNLEPAWPDIISEVWLGPLHSDPMARASIREFMNRRDLSRSGLSASKTPIRETS
jgi:hypothetical protein